MYVQASVESQADRLHPPSPDRLRAYDIQAYQELPDPESSAESVYSSYYLDVESQGRDHPLPGRTNSPETTCRCLTEEYNANSLYLVNAIQDDIRFQMYSLS